MFEHLKSNVVVQKYNEIAVWKPPSWVSSKGQPPPELRLRRISDTNLGYARAQVNPRLPQVKQRTDGNIKQQDLAVKRERAILICILSCVDGWDNVPEADGRPSVLGKISGESTDPGTKQVRDLLRFLGPDAELSFCAFCGDTDNWLVEDAEPEDEADAVPLR